MNRIFLLACLLPLVMALATTIERLYLINKVHYQTLIFWAAPVALLTGLIFGYVYRDIIRQDMKRLHLRDFCLMMFKMFLTFFIASIINYTIQAKLKSFELASIQMSFPILVLLFGFLFLKETINKQQVLGFMLLLSGLYIVLTRATPDETQNLKVIFPKLNIQK